MLPFTVFLKLKDIGGNVLPSYDEEFREVAMDTAQTAAYRDLSGRLTTALKQALAKRDTTLLGVVLNVLLAWPVAASGRRRWCTRARARPWPSFRLSSTGWR